jgi:hypothetical protein
LQLSLSPIRNTATSAEAAVILMLHPSLRAGLTNAQPQARAIITLSGMSLSDMPAAVCAAEMPSRPIPVAILRLQGGTRPRSLDIRRNRNRLAPSIRVHRQGKGCCFGFGEAKDRKRLLLANPVRMLFFGT